MSGCELGITAGDVKALAMADVHLLTSNQSASDLRSSNNISNGINTRKSLHEILNEILAKKPQETCKLVESRLKELGLHYYNDYAIVIISWTSLSTKQPDIVLKPTDSIKDTVFRFTKVHTPNPDIHIHIYSMRDVLSTYVARRIGSPSTTKPTFLEDVASIWLSNIKLRNQHVCQKTLKDGENLSIITSELAKTYKTDHAIEIALHVHSVVPVDILRDIIKEKVSITRADEALAILQPTIDRINFADYVDKHRSVCIYDDSMPVRVIEVPGGIGLFADILPKSFIIDPFIVITTDTLEAPIEPLDNTEEKKLDELPTDSPLRKAIRYYYILRRNSRERKSRDLLSEYISVGCYATRLLFFKTRKDADLVVTKLCQSRGKYIKPLKE